MEFYSIQFPMMRSSNSFISLFTRDLHIVPVLMGLHQSSCSFNTTHDFSSIACCQNIITMSVELLYSQIVERL
jgi:hypothetical protein